MRFDRIGLISFFCLRFYRKYIHDYMYISLCNNNPALYNRIPLIECCGDDIFDYLTLFPPAPNYGGSQRTRPNGKPPVINNAVLGKIVNFFCLGMGGFYKRIIEFKKSKKPCLHALRPLPLHDVTLIKMPR